MKHYFTGFFLTLLLTAFPLLSAAQTPDQTSLTWDDVPAPPVFRHIGDWMVDAGWESAADVYGPFTEAPFDIGDTATFVTLDYSTDNGRQSYVLRHISENAYFWFPPGYSASADDLQTAGQYIDSIIVPEIEALFGAPNQPGIDGDPRLHIVHNEYIGFGAVGVFRPTDQCAQFLCEDSNQRDVIYYSLDWGAVNTDEYLTTIAHEYQHVIRFANDGNERRWMNEGLSQLGEHLSGFAPDIAAGGNLEVFLSNPNHRLDGWSDITGDPSSYYGAGYLFTVYLYERFGVDFIRALAASPYDGLAAVHRVLMDGDYGISLDALFSDWLLANYLDDPFIDQGQYYYANLRVPVRVSTDAVSLSAGTALLNRAVNQYGATYLQLDSGTYQLVFDGDDWTPTTGIRPASGDWMWWSYNNEASATRLTRQVDLTQVETASLEFSIWYDTEEDFDWLDIMVSTDGGNYWKPLKANGMEPASDQIPVPAFTGYAFEWQREKIDLSEFVGQQILLRFEYITDSTITQTGALLDDITIPEIDFFDNAETLDADWITEGFIRVPYTIRQNWDVSIITNGNSPTVERLPLNADNIIQHTLTVPDSGAIIVIGAMAPLTTERAEYKLVIEARD